FRNVTTLRGTLKDGTEVSVAGTLTGPRMVEKIVGINGFDFEVPLTDHLAVFRYADRPGIIGAVGNLLGEADLNIGAMQVARSATRDHALMVLNIDTEITREVAADIATAIGSDHFAVVNL
ncbi:MAG TPA: ACT domain-containing protein, partial [Dermatophilaceae bacterium]|nr:ACT domain-containing protein [Dermatophilaceae bacterium]